MNYHIEDIPPEGLLVRGKQGGEWLEHLFQDQKGLEFDWISPISYDIRISRAGSRIMVQGSLNVTLQLSCSRCLEHVTFAVDPEFRFFFSPPHSLRLSPEVELQREDLDIEFYSDDALDVRQIIRDQIILTLPLNPLCKESCKGLCPYCGRNKNQGTCECSGEALMHPNLEILKDFLKK